nr:hypothetical protein [Tanacetum cinerariifolium]
MNRYEPSMDRFVSIGIRASLTFRGSNTQSGCLWSVGLDPKRVPTMINITVTKEDVGSEEETTPHISLNALIGRNTFQTMRVIGHICKYEIHILVDSGSTHNFIDCEIARKVKLQLKNEEFCADMMVLPLRGCEMVLGIQWLSTLGIQSAPTVLKTLLEKYADVFAIPKELPPFRSHGHKIPLNEGTLPINIRPYRHPPIQKDAIGSDDPSGLA